MIGTLVRILVAFAVACVVAGVAQVTFALAPMDIVTDDPEQLAGNGYLTLCAATQCAVFAFPFGVLMVAMAEAQAIRSWAYYAFAGFAIATAGFVAQYSSEGNGQPSIINSYALTAFLVSGVLAGIVYWSIAGRLAGGDSTTHRQQPGETGPPAPLPDAAASH